MSGVDNDVPRPARIKAWIAVIGTVFGADKLLSTNGDNFASVLYGLLAIGCGLMLFMSLDLAMYDREYKGTRRAVVVFSVLVLGVFVLIMLWRLIPGRMNVARIGVSPEVCRSNCDEGDKKYFDSDPEQKNLYDVTMSGKPCEISCPFDVSTAGYYDLRSTYAANRRRPIQGQIGNNKVNLFERTTPTWVWPMEFVEAHGIWLDAGPNSLKFTPVDQGNDKFATPHVAYFELVMSKDQRAGGFFARWLP